MFLSGKACVIQKAEALQNYYMCIFSNVRFRYAPGAYSTCPPEEDNRKSAEQRDNFNSSKDYLSSLVKDCMRNIMTRLDKLVFSLGFQKALYITGFL